jgi:membrane-associated phospholipid phosphatase
VRDADGTVPRADASAARLLVSGVAVAVVLAVVIVWVLADDLRPTAWDMTLHRAGMEHRTAGLTAVAVAVSASSEYLAYVVAAVGTLLALRTRPWWWGAIAGVLLLAVGQGIRVALAAAIGRSRPPEADWEMHAAGFSMPSGHTTTATFAAGLLCLGLARGVRSAWRFAAMAALVLWAVLDGVGRVYIGVHWATDVVAGWLLGALLTVLAAGLFARVRTAGRQKGEPVTVDPSGRPGRSDREVQRSSPEVVGPQTDTPGRAKPGPGGPVT